MAEVPICGALRKDGSTCQARVRVAGATCWAHDERNAEQRKAMASHAATAKGRKPAEVEQLKAKLRQLAEDVETGAVETGRASVASQIYGTLIKLLEFERKNRETQQLEERLEELELLFEELERRQGRRAW